MQQSIAQSSFKRGIHVDGAYVLQYITKIQEEKS